MDSKLQARRKTAPPTLIIPVQNLISMAMRRLKEGIVDDVDRRCVHLGVKADSRHRVYDVADVSVKDWDPPREWMLAHGLFISQMDLDSEGNPLECLDAIQAPRLPKLVNRESISLLRGILPESIEEATRDLDGAVVISEQEWTLLVLKARAMREVRSFRQCASVQ